MYRFFLYLLIFFVFPNNIWANQVLLKRCSIVSDGYSSAVLYKNQVIPGTVKEAKDYQSYSGFQEFIKNYKSLQDLGFCPELNETVCSVDYI